MVETDRAGGETHLVVCVEQVVGHRGERHLHVAAVETEIAADRTRRWGMVDAVTAIRRGDRFVAGIDPGGSARFEPTVCPSCAVVTLTMPDAADIPDCSDFPRRAWKAPGAR
jgi:hypothetical protein